jgi:hypothetical protein
VVAGERPPADFVFFSAEREADGQDLMLTHELYPSCQLVFLPCQALFMTIFND